MKELMNELVLDRLIDNGILLLEIDKMQGLLFIKQDEMYFFVFYVFFRQFDKILKFFLSYYLYYFVFVLKY